MKETFYIDSNVFLYPVLYGDLEESERAREILSQIERKDIQAYTSTLTWDEVSYVIERTLGKTDAIEIGKKFLKGSEGSNPSLRMKTKIYIMLLRVFIV